MYLKIVPFNRVPMVRGRTPSPDQPKPHPSSSSSSDTMATMVVPPPSAAITKRYRPAPAKTFQCRGYGECRMVFSRSEHLARHIRYRAFTSRLSLYSSRRQETHRRAPFYLPLREAIFTAGQPASACTDGALGQAGGQRADDAGSHDAARIDGGGEQVPGDSAGAA